MSNLKLVGNLNLFVATSCFLCFFASQFVDSVSAQDSGEEQTVRVFLLAGQSNMQGQGVVDLDHPEHYNGGKGILNSLLADEEKKSMLTHAHDGEGNWITRDDVFVRHQTKDELKIGGLTIGFTSYPGKHHIGPEFQFGHLLGEEFAEPVVLIKTAWGGKSLYKDFRPPSAGGEVGPYFSKMIEEYREAMASIRKDFPALGQRRYAFELSGFVWFQGWNDMFDEKALAEYEDNLKHLINDVRAELDSPNLPVVVGELGNGGEDANDNMKRIRLAQLRATGILPFVGNVGFVKTSQFARPKEESPNVGHGHHWFGNAESYFLIGDALGKEMVELVRNQEKLRVLILGDSISIGYGPTVAAELNDSAAVYRPTNLRRGPENCQGTNHGVKRIDQWLQIGGGNWDVIHFNFGLHDLKHVDPKTGKNSQKPEDPQQANPQTYERQLRAIVDKLKATGARLVFCTTTPVPEGVKPFRDPDSPRVYNEIATKIMDENGIDVIDLYSFANERLAEIQQPANVHFSRAGSVQLGEFVADELAPHLKFALEQSLLSDEDN